ncbi:MAG: DUF3298 and DUF4163 domain-containing protein [Butyrivibrio sp.]|nr:DUF3298 and DUF4163 domain-containing protein [Butyrivibrio sp.]
MKKKICIMMGVIMLTLSACGAQNDGQSPADSPATTEASQASSETEAKKEEQGSADSKGEEAATEKSDIPELLVRTEYLNNYYKGSFTEDAEGNSLEHKTLFEGSVQALMVSKDSEKDFPELYKAVNDIANEYIDASKANADEMADTAKEDLEMSITEGYSFFGPYSDRSVTSVTRVDDKILSYIDNYYSFSGGAHGIYGLQGRTFDVTTGKELLVSDVISLSEEELNSILVKKIEETTDDPDTFWDLEDTLSSYKYDPMNTDPVDYENYEYPYVWYLDYDGIHFYFGPYAIAAYANGATDVSISYEELAGKLSEKYLPDTSKGYITGIDLPMYSDEYDDDSSDLHFVYTLEGENTMADGYQTCKALTLKEKDRSATADIYFEYDYDMPSVHGYYVRTDDGREYVYATVLSYNDYTELVVFDLSDGGIKLVGQESFHMAYIDAGDDNFGELIITDPENMPLGKVSDMMGTFTCFGSYRVGKDGMPELKENVYKISWISDSIKTKKDVEITLLEEDGTVVRKDTLVADSPISPFRTDMETYIDARLPDGQIVRFTYSNGKYPYEIGGVQVDDLFDGLQYAG